MKNTSNEALSHNFNVGESIDSYHQNDSSQKQDYEAAHPEKVPGDTSCDATNSIVSSETNTSIDANIYKPVSFEALTEQFEELIDAEVADDEFLPLLMYFISAKNKCTHTAEQRYETLSNDARYFIKLMDLNCYKESEAFSRIEKDILEWYENNSPILLLLDPISLQCSFNQISDESEADTVFELLIQYHTWCKLRHFMESNR